MATAQFESTNRKGVRYEILSYNKQKRIVKLKDAEGVEFELPESIIRDRRYKLVKEP